MYSGTEDELELEAQQSVIIEEEVAKQPDTVESAGQCWIHR